MKNMLMALALTAGAVFGCAASLAEAQRPEPCTPTWYRYVEMRVPTGDGAGHGPDLGSNEWKSVVEFKLGIRGDRAVPDINSDSWCRYIDDLLAAND